MSDGEADFKLDEHSERFQTGERLVESKNQSLKSPGQRSGIALPIDE